MQGAWRARSSAEIAIWKSALHVNDEDIFNDAPNNAGRGMVEEAFGSALFEFGLQVLLELGDRGGRSSLTLLHLLTFLLF